MYITYKYMSHRNHYPRSESEQKEYEAGKKNKKSLSRMRSEERRVGKECRI